MSLCSDLAFILADAPGSVTVTSGPVTGPALLREASKLVEHSTGRLKCQGKERALIFDPATLPIEKGSSLVVTGEELPAAGRSYQVMVPVLCREDGSAIAILTDPA
jgi:hypothetical protein